MIVAMVMSPKARSCPVALVCLHEINLSIQHHAPYQVICQVNQCVNTGLVGIDFAYCRHGNAVPESSI